MKAKTSISDVMNRWCELTGTTSDDAAMRYRCLRQSGFMSLTLVRATDLNVAQLIIAMLCGNDPSSAPAEAMDIFDAYPAETNRGDVVLTEKPFGIALGVLIRAIRRGAPIKINRLSIRTDGAEMGAAISMNFAGREMVAVWHAAPETERPRRAFPVDRERSVDGAAVHTLAEMVTDRVTGLQPHERALADIIVKRPPIGDRIAAYIAKIETQEA
jgi:hypothetical protein